MAEVEADPTLFGDWIEAEGRGSLLLPPVQFLLLPS